MTDTEDTSFGHRNIALMPEAAIGSRGKGRAACADRLPANLCVRFPQASKPELGFFQQQFRFAAAAVQIKEPGLSRSTPIRRVLLMLSAYDPQAVAQAVADAQVAQ
jgi:hypothetical protein